MSDNAIHDSERTAYLQARAALTEWDWAEVERPEVYADLHSPMLPPGVDPLAVRERLGAQLAQRRGARA